VTEEHTPRGGTVNGGQDPRIGAHVVTFLVVASVLVTSVVVTSVVVVVSPPLSGGVQI